MKNVDHNENNVYDFNNNENDPENNGNNLDVVPPRMRKSVSFADDKGLQLVKISIITEPSDVPPILRSHIVQELLEKENNNVATVNNKNCWTLLFNQPNGDYLSFRNKLDRQNVSLEKVNVTSDVHQIRGSVKLKRFGKTEEVQIRYTVDNWTSFVDHSCTFAPHLNNMGLPFNIDTFEFSIDVASSKICVGTTFEFCVRYKTNDDEFWDNNNGENYKIVLQNVKRRSTYNDDVRPLAKFTLDVYSTDYSEMVQYVNYCNVATESIYW